MRRRYVRAVPALAITAALAAAVATAGCVVVRTTTVFDEEQQAQAAAQLAPGEGRIAGHAFVHAAGRTYTAAGDWITLIPATAYADERVLHIYGAARRSSPGVVRADAPDPDYVRLSRRTKADIHGRFAFDGLRPGPWYVFAVVSWEKDRRDHQIAIHERVVLGPGESKTVVLSGT